MTHSRLSFSSSSAEQTANKNAKCQENNNHFVQRLAFSLIGAFNIGAKIELVSRHRGAIVAV
jgi:hypothetical protein